MSEMNYNAKWDNTQIGKDRLERKIEIIGNVPHYQGRHIIGRNSPIDGGVYLGSGEREAIVVDFENSPGLQNIYRRTIEKCTEGDKFYRARAIAPA